MSEPKDLVDRLTEAAMEVKTLISDLHTLRKTLRADLKEARDVIKELEDTTTAVIQQEVSDRLTAVLNPLEDKINESLDLKVKAVIKEFERVVDIVFTNQQTGEDWREAIDGGKGRLV